MVRTTYVSCQNRQRKRRKAGRKQRQAKEVARGRKIKGRAGMGTTETAKKHLQKVPVKKIKYSTYNAVTCNSHAVVYCNREIKILAAHFFICKCRFSSAKILDFRMQYTTALKTKTYAVVYCNREIKILAAHFFICKCRFFSAKILVFRMQHATA